MADASVICFERAGRLRMARIIEACRPLWPTALQQQVLDDVLRRLRAPAPPTDRTKGERT